MAQYLTAIGTRSGFRRLTQQQSPRISEDRKFISAQYYDFNGFLPNLSQPAGLSEKICWQKIRDPAPVIVQCTDKIRVRSFVENRLGPEYLPDLYFVSRKSADINAANIPNEQFVVKTNNGNGGINRCTDRSTFDWDKCRSVVKSHLTNNYYDQYREMQYRDIEPFVFAEELLLPSGNATDLPDYKFFCFHGEPKLIQIDMNRFDHHSRDFRTPKWRELDVTYDDGIPESKAECPEMLSQLTSVARELSKGFSFVRVDLYQTTNRIVFGEMTFTPGAGTKRFLPESFEMKMGGYWQTE